MLRYTLLMVAAAIHHINAQTVDSLGITNYEKVEAIERQLLDPFTLNSLVSPCSVNFGDDPNRGEQTSAQWVRIVFHDAITKGIAGPGLGYDSHNNNNNNNKSRDDCVLTTCSGLDASISFESDREENIGVFVNITIKQFALFSSPFMSMADLIGVVSHNTLFDTTTLCVQH